jgi:hypothetical protein
LLRGRIGGDQQTEAQHGKQVYDQRGVQHP